MVSVRSGGSCEKTDIALAGAGAGAAAVEEPSLMLIVAKMPFRARDAKCRISCEEPEQCCFESDLLQHTAV